jgi:hypothetical protein
LDKPNPQQHSQVLFLLQPEKENKDNLRQDLSPEFAQYHRVFSDEQAQRLPKNQPWDHRIELIPGKEMGKTSIYRLTPLELQALKEYLEDGEKRGTL